MNEWAIHTVTIIEITLVWHFPFALCDCSTIPLLVKCIIPDFSAPRGCMPKLGNRDASRNFVWRLVSCHVYKAKHKILFIEWVLKLALVSPEDFYHLNQAWFFCLKNKRNDFLLRIRHLDNLSFSFLGISQHLKWTMLIFVLTYRHTSV